MFTIGKNKNGSGSYSFSEDNYNAGLCGQGHNLTGDITQGDPNYDAARANMGYPYMMPTFDQGRELINNTTSGWTTINKVNGRIFISKSNTQKYIFIPAAGNFTSATHGNVGERGIYWTTTLSSTNWSYYLDFYSNGSSWGGTFCYGGKPIRPIAPPKSQW